MVKLCKIQASDWWNVGTPCGVMADLWFKKGWWIEANIILDFQSMCSMEQTRKWFNALSFISSCMHTHTNFLDKTLASFMCVYISHFILNVT